MINLLNCHDEVYSALLVGMVLDGMVLCDDDGAAVVNAEHMPVG